MLHSLSIRLQLGNMKVEAITVLAICCNIRLRDITGRVKLRETTGFRLGLSQKVRVKENITR
jgi:hypothetical protein